MIEMTSDRIAVPGSSLYYEVRGQGPALLLIHGGGADAGSLERLAEALAADRTVISYDVRGYGRSPLGTEAAAQPSQVSVDAADAARLIGNLTDDDAVEVFGSSSGAIIALELLTRHPERVRAAVLHEPPIVALLPDAPARKSFFESMYATYLEEGADAAMARHLAAIGMAPMNLPPGITLPPQVLKMLERIPANQVFFLEHEIQRVPSYLPDYAVLQALPRLADRLILAGGLDSREQYPSRPNHVLAERLGLTVIDFPGDHLGYVRHPAEFAARLLAALPPIGFRGSGLPDHGGGARGPGPGHGGGRGRRAWE